MALLTKKSWSIELREAKWKAILRAGNFDSHLNYISSDECKLSPKRALELRIDVLKRIYRGDYHTDAFDITKLLHDISSGKEKIFFWGDHSEIEKARKFLATENKAIPNNVNQLFIGTATIIRRAEEGPNIDELSRTGSLSTLPFSIYANVLELDKTFDSKIESNTSTHIIYSTPRNREATIEIRGGVAIQRQHSHELNSSFLGWAPWYIMQGGYIEILDYRELYKFPNLIWEKINNTKALYFFSKDDAEFVKCLLRLNFNNINLPLCDVQATHGISKPIWTKLSLVPEELEQFNPLFIKCNANVEGKHLNVIMNEIRLAEFACICIEINLEEMESLQYQKLVIEYGFHFIGIRIFPLSYEPKDLQQKIYEIKGMWVSLKRETPLAEPYYLKLNGFSNEERDTLKHLMRIMKSINENS